MAISVIIPVGPGREDNLRLALFGLSRQHYRSFETVIVTNDEATALEFDGHYVPNESPNLGAVNRNRGVELAKNDLLVFIDSDVVLHRDCLQYYAEDFANFQNRAVLGLYHWLPPMIVTEDDIEDWDEFINAELPPAVAGYRHNIGRDGREKSFLATHRDLLHCDYPGCLQILSGNMGISRKCFEAAGGFDEEISRGVDGSFGIALCAAGHSWSYDSRIVGGHLYHERYQPAMALDPFPRIRARWHTDDSWIGRMTWGKTWGWEE